MQATTANLKPTDLEAQAVVHALVARARAADKGVLGTILAGMAVYLPLHIGLGW